MKNNKLIKDIIKRKQKGVDCTESESAELKGFIRENLMAGNGNIESMDILDSISILFPLEYSEACEEQRIMDEQ